MNLFICQTPLHCLIVEQIINKEDLLATSCEILYISYNNKEQLIHKKYFEKLENKVLYSNYLQINKKIFFYFGILKKLFKNKNYTNVYFANIDMPIIHYILSLVNFKYLYTFDDGVGNLVKDSCFYKQKKTLKSVVRGCVYFLFGNRFNVDKIKRISCKHYTIYHGMKNIHDSLCYLKLFPNSINSNEVCDKNETCIVFLGTVYNEVLSNTDKREHLICLLQKFIDSLNCSVIYMPHPRDSFPYFNNVIHYNNNELSEFEVFKLACEYKQIYLYGFISTVQFNLITLSNIKNFYFSSEILRGDVNTSYNKLGESFYFEKVSLDYFDKKNQ